MDGRLQKKYENLFRALREQQIGAAKVESFPISLCLDPASACSLHCPFCIHGKFPFSKTYRIMEWEMFQSIMDELGPYLFQVDLFNWGEPLLNKRLLDMIACLRSFDIKVRLSTSLAVRLPEDFLEGLVLSGVNYIIVSIDGMSPETYEQYRVDGDFHLAMSNLEKMARLKHTLKLDKPRLEWQYLVFSFNEHELPQAIRQARKIGVEFRAAAPYVDLDQHSNWLSSDSRYVREPYRASVAKGKESSKNSSGWVDRSMAEAVGVQAMSDPAEAYESPANDKEPSPAVLARPGSLSPSPCRCDWHYLKACINADHTLSPCCGLYPGDPNWGDLGEASFHRHWNNNNLKGARATVAAGSKSTDPDIICSRCPLPEIQLDCHSVLLDALLDAPARFKKQARQVLEGLPRRDRLERQSLRLAGKMMRYLPYSFRDPLRRRLRYETAEGVLRRGLKAFLKLVDS